MNLAESPRSNHERREYRAVSPRSQLPSISGSAAAWHEERCLFVLNWHSKSQFPHRKIKPANLESRSGDLIFAILHYFYAGCRIVEPLATVAKWRMMDVFSLGESSSKRVC